MLNAKWIWQNNNNNKNEYINFIDEFSNEDNSNIILNISCDTDYTVYINGKFAAFGQYANYPYYKVYMTILIFQNLQKKGITVLQYAVTLREIYFLRIIVIGQGLYMKLPKTEV